MAAEPRITRRNALVKIKIDRLHPPDAAAYLHLELTAGKNFQHQVRIDGFRCNRTVQIHNVKPFCARTFKFVGRVHRIARHLVSSAVVAAHQTHTAAVHDIDSRNYNQSVHPRLSTDLWRRPSAPWRLRSRTPLSLTLSSPCFLAFPSKKQAFRSRNLFFIIIHLL